MVKRFRKAEGFRELTVIGLQHEEDLGQLQSLVRDGGQFLVIERA